MEKRLSIDILTPGLNPKLEQKAILLQEYLFDLLISVISVLSLKFSQVRLLFPSIGDAASFQKYHRKIKGDVPTNIILSDVSLERISNLDDCAVFITAKNNIGDPVIRTIQTICETYPQLTAIFLNCDLSDRVTAGMQEKRIRDAFRASIHPVYYFRNLVRISRPSMTPYELGVLRYMPTRGWETYVTDDNDIKAMGSLNRYMKVGSFQRSSVDSNGSNGMIQAQIYKNGANIHATALAPPRLVLAKKYEGISSPSREDIDNSIMNTLALLERKHETKSINNQNINNLRYSTDNSFSSYSILETPSDVKSASELLYKVSEGQGYTDIYSSDRKSSILGKSLLTGISIIYKQTYSPKPLKAIAGGMNPQSILGDQPVCMTDVVQIGISTALPDFGINDSARLIRPVGDWEAAADIIVDSSVSYSEFLMDRTSVTNLPNVVMKMPEKRVILSLTSQNTVTLMNYMRAWIPLPLSMSWRISSLEGSYQVASNSANVQQLIFPLNDKYSKMSWLFTESTGNGARVGVTYSQDFKEKKNVYTIWRKIDI